MAKGVNATIAISQQTQNQRNAFRGDTTTRGVGTDQAVLEKIFPNTPIQAKEVDSMYRSTADNLNRMSTIAGDDRSVDIISGNNSIYDVYANAIDSVDAVNGFGFYGGEQAHINYRHQNNPFLPDDSENANFQSLTTGLPATEPDNAQSKKRYLGYPDPRPETLTNPQESEEAKTVSEDALHQNNNNFGSDTSNDRLKINTNSTSLLGRHVKASEGSEIDSIGKYFSRQFLS